MKKIKLILNQTMIISTAILFGIGVRTTISHLASDYETMRWPWYVPISIVLTGFICSVPTLFLYGFDGLSKKAIWAKIVVHFFLVGAIVSGCGKVFGWYDNFKDYLLILIMYILIYVFVWSFSGWIAKTDEKKINEAIKDIQDEE